MKKIKDKDNFYSVTEAAKLLGISREAVLKKINTGKLKAERIGHIFAIPKNELGFDGQTLSKEQEEIIEAGVKKTVKEYGETLKRLGKE
ncbi:MAG: binding domain protein, excisionase family protein [Berkelbacteria bacterium GW2011_GWB1_38_5]|uniref:Binding domain protein, excisionase family protein n=1 Tax=Berkelbacteria bacterium GW2011_GWB1_38_5 TaxID=1618336 RepID=A0A0G0NAL7_9BACT|nr:MAG: binding domain protein, excisionase family protein [Berkelbacteria bacterium GW2011_GWB1_38_5]